MSVTGLKAWHLRPGSDFYTSASFDAAVLSLPRGAALIAVLGQIDCREVTLTLTLTRTLTLTLTVTLTLTLTLTLTRPAQDPLRLLQARQVDAQE